MSNKTSGLTDSMSLIVVKQFKDLLRILLKNVDNFIQSESLVTTHLMIC